MIAAHASSGGGATLRTVMKNAGAEEISNAPTDGLVTKALNKNYGLSTPAQTLVEPRLSQ